MAQTLANLVIINIINFTFFCWKWWVTIRKQVSQGNGIDIHCSRVHVYCSSDNQLGFRCLAPGSTPWLSLYIANDSASFHSGFLACLVDLRCIEITPPPPPTRGVATHSVFAWEKLLCGILIGNLKVNKSCGYDGMPNKVLKLIGGALAPSLTMMFEASIWEKYQPKEWKKGEWVPVYKRDNPKDVRNYRPVTVLSAVGKIFV